MTANRAQAMGLPDAAADVKGFFFDAIDRFDNLLFGIAPPEARSMDPQERALLESAWACFEDSGYRNDILSETLGRIAVFTGVMWDDYQQVGAEAWRQDERAQVSSNPSGCANRISFAFDCRGPSVSVNTSCSSGLTALHLAIDCLFKKEADVALVGGVNLISHPRHLALLRDLKLLSPNSCARPFSQYADGWVIGEGVGTMLVKPLEAAIEARDHIHLVIEATTLSHTGRTTRYTAPAPERQAEALASLLSGAGVHAREVDYVEAAAPGAGLADAAEIQALATVYERAGAICRVGSVKGLVGHLESASFFSQIAKVAFQMRSGRLLASEHTVPVSRLALRTDSVRVLTQAEDWDSAPLSPRRAIIAANGATGSGGHALVREPPSRIGERASVDLPVLVPLSAPTPSQLVDLTKRLLATKQGIEGLRAADIALSLASGRAEQRYRTIFSVSSTEELTVKLANFIDTNGRDKSDCTDCEKPSFDGTLTDSRFEEFATAWLAAGASLMPLVDYLNVRSAIRISLPTLPFAGGSYWLSPATSSSLAQDDAPNEASVTRSENAMPLSIRCGERRSRVKPPRWNI